MYCNFLDLMYKKSIVLMKRTKNVNEGLYSTVIEEACDFTNFELLKNHYTFHLSSLGSLLLSPSSCLFIRARINKRSQRAPFAEECFTRLVERLAYFEIDHTQRKSYYPNNRCSVSYEVI